MLMCVIRRNTLGAEFMNFSETNSGDLMAQRQAARDKPTPPELVRPRWHLSRGREGRWCPRVMRTSGEALENADAAAKRKMVKRDGGHFQRIGRCRNNWRMLLQQAIAAVALYGHRGIRDFLGAQIKCDELGAVGATNFDPCDALRSSQQLDVPAAAHFSKVRDE